MLVILLRPGRCKMLTRIIGLGVTACAGFRLWQLLRARSQSSTIYGAFPALQLTPLLRSHHADDTHKVTPEYSSAQERYAGRRINVHLLDMRISSRPPSDPQLQQMLRATVIGMDAEWEPETSGTRSRQATAPSTPSGHSPAQPTCTSLLLRTSCTYTLPV